MNKDILSKINAGKFEITGTVKQIVKGNQYTDFYNGIKEIGYTTLKLRCNGFTVMVFKNDIKLFNNIKIGDDINVILKPSKWESVFHFKKFGKEGIIKNKDWDDFKI